MTAVAPPDIDLCVIGAGNMAEALLRGALAAGVLPRNRVVVCDPQPSRRELFERDLGLCATADNAAAAQAGKVLLAVKPQVMAAVLDGLRPLLRPDVVVISIVAGVRIESIAGKLRRDRIIRVMPNMPMLVGMGASALCKSAAASDADRDWAARLFAACGTTVVVDEPMIDAVTAVSGSGPAYFFYLVEAMVAAGVAEGLDPAVALQLAVQTCRGAGELLYRSGESPQALRARVTSPNGTTQAAIEKLDAANLNATLAAAIRRAAERSRELGK